MTELRNRMIADMKLHGLAPGTQKVYVKAVQRLAGHYHRAAIARHRIMRKARSSKLRPVLLAELEERYRNLS